jgi:Ca2+-binding EF-hand superfamily protein
MSDELRRVFDLYDKDGNGSLDREEVAGALSTLGLAHEASDEVFTRLDKNRDGVVSFDEFAEATRLIRSEVDALFSWIDADGSGSISEAELRAAFEKLRLRADSDAVSHLFARMDTDGNGQIDRAEFRALFSLARPVDLLRRYRDHEDASLLADLQALTGGRKKTTASALSGTQQEVARMLMGGTSAVFAQLCVQPIETVKGEFVSLFPSFYS